MPLCLLVWQLTFCARIDAEPDAKHETRVRDPAKGSSCKRSIRRQEKRRIYISFEGLDAVSGLGVFARSSSRGGA